MATVELEAAPPMADLVQQGSKCVGCLYPTERSVTET
jgi:hypothetical protein